MSEQMTAQEAITALKLEKITIEGNAIRVADFFRGLSVANIALEKQVPQKVKIKDFRLRCPICNLNVGSVGCPERNFCPSCGQALDWSEI